MCHFLGKMSWNSNSVSDGCIKLTWRDLRENRSSPVKTLLHKIGPSVDMIYLCRCGRGIYVCLHVARIPSLGSSSPCEQCPRGELRSCFPSHPHRRRHLSWLLYRWEGIRRFSNAAQPKTKRVCIYFQFFFLFFKDLGRIYKTNSFCGMYNNKYTKLMRPECKINSISSNDTSNAVRM